MKKILLCLTLLCSLHLGYAQKLLSGSLAALEQETRLNVQIDYSEALLDNLTLEDFVLTHNNWELAQTELWGKLVENLNDKLSRRSLRMVCGHFKDAYTLVLRVQVIDRRGNQRSLVDIRDREGNVIAVLQVSGDGGHIGSFYNLAGDGMEDVGDALGRYLRRPKNTNWEQFWD
jgi:hypothetical protein